MKGYKAFNKNLKCRNMQYEIGGTYNYDGEIEVCHSGFHFCKTIADCYKFYSKTDDTRICEVEAIGEIKTNDNIKFCTDKIIILSEVENPKEKSNIGGNNSGYCNSGCNNSGDRNSGFNNSGDGNGGDFNSGNYNSGYYNSGDYNSGCWNIGECNSGCGNIGDYNSGNGNSGNRNSGNYNSGDYNSGDWNSGDWNSGIFNTMSNPKIKIFDEESDWTIKDWLNSAARYWMEYCPISYDRWIKFEEMTEDEKKSHPGCEITGGFLREVKATDKDRQKWWDELREEQKESIRSLPNFNAKKFKKCTGINPN